MGMSRKKYAVFTMDVEAFSDTECVAKSESKVDVDLLDGFDEYMKILDKHNIKSTLFTVGTLAPQIADRLKKNLENGHRLALHGHTHVAPMDVKKEIFRAEVGRAKKLLEEIFKTDVEGFRAPFFSLDNARLDILKELGFRYDSSRLNFSKARHTVELDMKDFNRISRNLFHNDGFFEFGLSKGKVFGKRFSISGGGYVRISNWTFVKTLIKMYLGKNDYYVFYLHPFELTRQEIPRIRGLKSYDRFYLKYGIEGYKKRIEKIISMLKKAGYEFVTFEELSERLTEKSYSVST